MSDGIKWSDVVPNNLDVKKAANKLIETWDGSYKKPAQKANKVVFSLGFLGTALISKLLNTLIELLNTLNFTLKPLSISVILGISFAVGLAFAYSPIIKGKLIYFMDLREGQTWVTVLRAFVARL